MRDTLRLSAATFRAIQQGMFGQTLVNV